MISVFLFIFSSSSLSSSWQGKCFIYFCVISHEFFSTSLRKPYGFFPLFLTGIPFFLFLVLSLRIIAVSYHNINEFSMTVPMKVKRLQSRRFVASHSNTKGWIENWIELFFVFFWWNYIHALFFFRYIFAFNFSVSGIVSFYKNGV